MARVLALALSFGAYVGCGGWTGVADPCDAGQRAGTRVVEDPSKLLS
jgi:hypothetical protein